MNLVSVEIAGLLPKSQLLANIMREGGEEVKSVSIHKRQKRSQGDRRRGDRNEILGSSSPGRSYSNETVEERRCFNNGEDDVSNFMDVSSVLANLNAMLGATRESALAPLGFGKQSNVNIFQYSLRIAGLNHMNH